MKTKDVPPRPQLTCPACRDGLIHRLITLHAEDDTIIVCGGAWEGLPKWMRDDFTEGKRGLARRREAARAIKGELGTWGANQS